MVSQLKNARQFYELQQDGKIAKNTPASKKLQFGRSGFYLNKKARDGTSYKQKVKTTDMVYSRNGEQGVTLYSGKRDASRTNVSHKKETVARHSKTAHMYDRTSLTGKVNYKK